MGTESSLWLVLLQERIEPNEPKSEISELQFDEMGCLVFKHWENKYYMPRLNKRTPDLDSGCPAVGVLHHR